MAGKKVCLYFALTLAFLLLATPLIKCEEEKQGSAEPGEKEPADDKKEETSDEAEGEKKEEKKDEEEYKVEEEFSEDGIKMENGVIVLTQSNFDSVINSKEIILVEFYAPWCGHCKALIPQYEAAAVRLADNHPPVALAKVDATQENDLAMKYDVTGYPTLKFFKKGVPYEYDGPREEEGIFQYMTERSAPDWKPPPDSVVVLTTGNFSDFVHSQDLTLVEFYAPWCGHCKSLAPEYEKAAKELKKNDPPIKLAKVDATQEHELAQQYDVSGYPSLKVFRHGKEYEYKGGRNKYDIVDFMKKQVGDPSKEKKTLREIKDGMLKDDVTVIGFFNNADEESYKTYQSACNELRDDFQFFHTFDGKAKEHYNFAPGSIVVFISENFYTKHEPKYHVLNKAGATISEIQDFFHAHSVPLVGHFTASTREKRYKDRRPLVLAFYTVDFSHDHRDATQLWRLKMAAIADQYQKKFYFAVADEDEQKTLFHEFGFDDSDSDLNIGILDEQNRKYPMEPMDDFNAETVKEFIDSYDVGDIKPRLKSQPVPKKQGQVKTVVAKTFENIVMDGNKDVLIELYAPWCGHCKKLEPVYKDLAKKFKKEKNLVIAKMDATANDVPQGYSAEGYPTIYFASRHNKKDPIKYEGDRDLDSLVKFVKEHNTVLAPPKKKKKKSKDEL